MPNQIPPTLDAVPEAIVVYQHRARVRRTAVIDPVLLASPSEAGEVQMLVRLPDNADTDSIQVEFNQRLAEVASLGGVTAEELDPDGDAANEGTSEQHREKLESRLKELRRQIAYAEQDIREADDNLKFVEEIAEGGLDTKNRILDGSAALFRRETWEAQLKALETARRTHGEARYKLQCRVKELEEETATVQRELQLFKSGCVARKKKHQAVRVVLCLHDTPVAGGENGDVAERKLYVSYMINEAGWEAAYEVHYDAKKAEVEVFYNAKVTLHRGEDFNNVRLTLCSTAPRNLGKEPELTPWRCGLLPPPPPPPAPAPAPHAPAGAGFCCNAAPMVMCAKAAKPMMLSGAATEEVSSGVANFAVKNVVSIKADGEARRFPLVRLLFRAEVEYISIPALEAAVYTRVLCTNDSEFLLLPGRAALFLDGDFLCSSHLPRAAPGGKLRIDFGVDRSVELKRVLLTELTAAQTKLLHRDSNKLIRTFRYRSTLTNRKTAEPVTVTIMEKAPKSNSEELKVRLVEPEALGSEEAKSVYDSSGRVELQVTVPPCGSAEAFFGFVVECPSGSRIYNLEARN
eukprot:gene8461-5937_t